MQYNKYKTVGQDSSGNKMNSANEYQNTLMSNHWVELRVYGNTSVNRLYNK